MKFAQGRDERYAQTERIGTPVQLRDEDGGSEGLGFSLALITWDAHPAKPMPVISKVPSRLDSIPLT